MQLKDFITYKMAISNNEIQKRLKEIASEINNKYNEITLLIVLTGGVYTGIDLSKYITIPCKIEFIKVSSYGNSIESSGKVKLQYISNTNLDNVLIIDDIFDTGNTMEFIINYVKENCKYNSVETMALLDKPARRLKDIKIDYIGFTIPNKFVYGYGLDIDGYKRNLLNINYN